MDLHVTRLDDPGITIRCVPCPFRSEEWRNLGLASCARLAANPGNGIIQPTPVSWKVHVGMVTT